jgi:tetraacyldisaccharide 4'-kinase
LRRALTIGAHGGAASPLSTCGGGTEAGGNPSSAVQPACGALPMTAPWHPEGGEPHGLAAHAASAALLPLEAAFRAVSLLRNRAYDAGVLRVQRAPVPVVSVGNLVVGGAGKTPIAAWLAARLRGWDLRPGIALRGYGEDEVLLHRELNPDVPVFADARRILAAREAAAAGCDVVVLDDGFQHRALARDLDIVLVPAEGWSAAPRLLPSGGWREPPGALRRAQVVVVTRKTADAASAAGVARDVRRVAPEAAIVHCALRATGLVPLHGGETRPLEWLRDADVLAVAGVARPAPFVASVRGAGAAVETALFPDHHAYGVADAAAIRSRAAGRPLLTTHKDAVKLRPLLSSDLEAYVLQQSVVIDEGLDALDAALRAAVPGAGA